MVIDEGWSGVILARGNAYIKNVDYLIKKEHMVSCKDCVAWVYDAAENTNTEEEEEEEEEESDEGKEAEEEVVAMEGEFIRDPKYGNNMNDFHYVTISHEGDNIYKWTNRANVSWTLTQDSEDPKHFHVGEECYYYKNGGHTVAEVILNENSEVTGILGPYNVLYTKVN